MKFIDTYRFSPVLTENDKPFQDDYFHLPPEAITKDFLAKGFYDIDNEWWFKQHTRCRYGFTVPNAIDFGGDAIVDEVDAFWNDSKIHERYIKEWDIFVPPNSVSIPQYNVNIKNREVWITNRHYFYLNFWKIYGIPPDALERYNKGLIEVIAKENVNPKFLDMDFLFYMRLKMMFEQRKDDSELKARQKGFEQPNSEPILTNKGWKTMEEIKIGDLVANKKGSYSKVSDIFPQGNKDVYEVELLDGRKTRCGINHLWKVYDKGLKKKREVVLSTQQLLNYGLTGKVNKRKNVSYRFALPEIEPVEFQNQNLPIDPYLLGLLLGDGTINRALKISSKDQEILNSIQSILGLDYELNFDKDSNCNYRIKFWNVHDKEQHKKYNKNCSIKLNPLKEELKKLNLLKCCHDKFIPEIYKHSSINQRLELIRGLMDTDGHISPDGCMEFKNCSKQLSYDLVYILRSLGIQCKIKEFPSPKGYSNFFRVYIRTTKYNLFKLTRKTKLFKPDKNIYKRCPIKSITKLPYQEMSSCILLDDEDHIYLTKDFIPTHNSEKLSGGIAAYNYLFMPASLTIIAGGMSDDADKTYLASKRGLENLRNTQFYKEYENSNLEFTHAANTGAEIRAISCRDNTQALNRFSPFFTIIEEGGKWKKDSLLETQEFAESATKAEGIKTGYKIYIYTGGSMDMGAADAETIHYNPDQFNCLKFRNNFEEEGACNGYTGHFTPSWMYRIIDKDGNSLRRESLIDIYAEESRKKADKKITFWTQNPIHASQAFMIPTGGFFGERIINMLNIRKAFIRTHTEDQIEERGRLEWNNPKLPFQGVHFVTDPKGHVILIEEPQKDKHGIVLKNLYKLGTDSYDKDEALTSTSMGSVSVFKGFYDANSTYKKYCMRITERPGISEGGKDIFYEDTAKACIYYGGINLIEWSNILIFEWYEKNGFASLLKERPDLAMASSVKKSKVFNKWGVDPNTKIHWLTKLRKHLEEPQSIEELYDMEQITAFAKFRYNPGKKYNCDITIASALCIVCYEDEMMYEVQTSDKANDFDEKPIRYIERNGQIVMV